MFLSNGQTDSLKSSDGLNTSSNHYSGLTLNVVIYFIPDPMLISSMLTFSEMLKGTSFVLL